MKNAFFKRITTIQTHLTPDEIERRLQRIVRKPRTIWELLRRVPPNPPEHPCFTGTIGNGRFKLSRLADIPSSVGWFHSERPCFHGTITPTANGSEIKIAFSDPGLSFLAVGIIAGASLVTLAITRGSPFWRIEHALLIFLIVLSLWAMRYSLNQDVEKSMAIIDACLRK